MKVAGIPIRIQRKNIKHLHLYVRPPDGRVEVSAPVGMDDETIFRFVSDKAEWIRKHREKFAAQDREAPRAYVSGETLYVWGRPYVLQVEQGRKGNSMVLLGEKAILTVRRESTAGQREAYIREWYRGLLKEETARRLPGWEDRTGLYCDSWQTKHMTTRWGTCNPATRKIWLNVQLAQKPVECLDYVLLHEIAHLKVPNHGKEFAAILDAHMPGWREVRKRLNGQGETAKGGPREI